MKFDELKKNWNEWAGKDPLWAICTDADKRGNQWDREDFFASGREEIAAMMRRAAEVRPGLTKGRVLDFGCGVGRLTQALGDHFDECMGVDISTTMVDLARDANRHGEGCAYLANDRQDLSQLADARFDLVYCSRVLQHMPPALALGYIGEFMRVLTKGGLAVFQVPSEQRGAKKLLKNVLPARLVNILRRAVYRSSAVMEMYTVSRETVCARIEGAQGVVVAIDYNEASGADYTSLVYYVMKQDD